MTQEVTHAQIYERLLAVETKVDAIKKNTKGLDRDMTTQTGFPWTITWPDEPQ